MNYELTNYMIKIYELYNHRKPKDIQEYDTWIQKQKFIYAVKKPG